MSKKELIYNYLLNGNAITQKIAIKKFNCKNLCGVISALDLESVNIKSYDIVKDGKRCKAYYIPELYKGEFPN